MSALVFVDTNIWFYALCTGDEAKRSAANGLLESLELPVINAQVVRELCVNLIKKSFFDESGIRDLVNCCIAIVASLVTTSRCSCVRPGCEASKHSATGIA
jgi:predicted nucleic acid-binding protein